RSPLFAPLARTSVRRARATRPWRPITLPTASSATRSSRTPASSRSVRRTSPGPGSATGSRATYPSSPSTALLDGLRLAQALGRLLHLLARGQELVHLLDRGPASLRDPRAARAVEDLGAATLVGRHREDDRLDTVELLVVDVDALKLLPEPGNHRDDVLERAHAAHHLVGL